MPSTTPGRRGVALLLTALLVTAGLVAPATARAPPAPFCGVCTDALDSAAAERGVDLARGDTAMTVTVHENGSTTWRATVDLESGADALRNDSLRRAVVEEATHRNLADPVGLRSRITDGTLVVTYRDPEAAERRGGTLVFTALTPASPTMPFVMGGEGPRYLGADEVTLRGPTSHVLYGDYADTTETERAVTWTTTGDQARTYPDASTDPVFVQSGAVLPGLEAWLARLLT